MSKAFKEAAPPICRKCKINPCAWYGVIGGYSKQCLACNEDHALNLDGQATTSLTFGFLLIVVIAASFYKKLGQLQRRAGDATTCEHVAVPSQLWWLIS